MPTAGTIQIRLKRSSAHRVGKVLLALAKELGEVDDPLYGFSRRLEKASRSKWGHEGLVKFHIDPIQAKAGELLLGCLVHSDFSREFEVSSPKDFRESVSEVWSDLARALSRRKARSWARSEAVLIVKDPSRDPSQRSRLTKRMRREVVILARPLTTLPETMKTLLIEVCKFSKAR